MIEFVIAFFAIFFVILGAVFFIKDIKGKGGCYNCNSCKKCPLSKKNKNC